MGNDRIGLFCSRDERLNISLPMLFLAGGGLGLFLKLPPPIAHWGDWVAFISATLFLQVIHQALTVVLVFVLPEGRSWLRTRPRALVASWLLAFFALVLFFKQGCGWLERSYGAAHPGVWIALVVSFISTAYHVVRQIMGISLAYNRRVEASIPLTHEQRERAKRAEVRERALFGALIVGVGLMVGIPVLEPLHSFKRLLVPSELAVAACSVAILVNSLSHPAGARSNKPAYLMRVLLFPLSTISYPALIAPIFYHGVEYLFVARKMCFASAARQAARQRIWPAIAGLAALSVLLVLPDRSKGLGWILFPMFPEHASLLEWLASASTAIAFMHFYFDGIIFKFRDPVTREHFGALLSGNGGSR